MFTWQSVEMDADKDVCILLQDRDANFVCRKYLILKLNVMSSVDI